MVLASAAILAELASTMERAKLDRYAALTTRREFVAFVYATARIVNVRRLVRASRDPHDDKFLEVAVNGGADALVTGDADLLALNPFEGTSIATPAEYLAKMGG